MTDSAICFSSKEAIRSKAKSSRSPKIRSPFFGPFRTSAGLAPKKKGVMPITRSPQMLKWMET